MSECEILVLEDDVLAGKLVQILIERQTQRRAMVIDSAEESVRYLRRTVADGGVLPLGVIADVGLRDGSSFRVVEWMRRSAATSGIKTLVMTATPAQGKRSQAADCGADFFVDKREFLASPRKWLEKLLGPGAIASAA